MTHPYALPEPAGIDEAATDGSVLELMRVWIAPTGPNITVRPAFDDPAAMGRMLAEVCWNFAEAYAQKDGIDRAQALAALRQGWTDGHADGEAHQAQGAA